MRKEQEKDYTHENGMFDGKESYSSVLDIGTRSQESPDMFQMTPKSLEVPQDEEKNTDYIISQPQQCNIYLSNKRFTNSLPSQQSPKSSHFRYGTSFQRSCICVTWPSVLVVFGQHKLQP